MPLKKHTKLLVLEVRQAQALDLSRPREMLTTFLLRIFVEGFIYFDHFFWMFLLLFLCDFLSLKCFGLKCFLHGFCGHSVVVFSYLHFLKSFVEFWV